MKALSALAAGVMLLASVSVARATLIIGGTVESLDGGDFQVGDKIFSDILVTGIDPSTVTVLGSINNDGSISIIFQGAFTDTTGSGTDYGVFYTVRTESGDPLIDSIDQAVTLGGVGTATITESVWENDYFSGLVAKSTVGIDVVVGEDNEDPPAEPIELDQLVIDPALSMVYVTKDIFLTASTAGGSIGATEIAQSYHQEGVVPEPGTMLLLGSGLLGLAGLSRRGKKNPENRC